MREEIKYSTQILKPNFRFSWETAITLLIKHMPFTSPLHDAYLTSGSAYSIKLNLWYYIAFPKEVVLRTPKHLSSNDNNRLVSINVLEVAIVVFSYCAARAFIVTHNLTDKLCPILLNAVDNIPAHSLITHTSKSSRIRKLLAKFSVVCKRIHPWNKFHIDQHNWKHHCWSHLTPEEAELVLFSTIFCWLLYFVIEASWAEELLFLPAPVRLVLDPMGHFFAEGVSKSQATKALKQSELGKLTT